MVQRRRHRPENRPVGRSLAVPVDNSADAAHVTARSRLRVATVARYVAPCREFDPGVLDAALLREGRLVASGPIEEVVTAENMRRCFDLEIEVEHRHGRWQAIVVPAPVNPA